MAIIKNEDLKTLVEIEELFHDYLEKNNKINENDKEYELWLSYWNFIEQAIQDKAKYNKKSALYNKKNAEYHRITNNLYNARKRKDYDKVRFYEEKLKKYKERS